VPKRQDNPERSEILLREPGTAWWHDESGTPITRRSRTAQLRSLCVLLDSAIDAQPLADEVIAACGEASGPSRDLIRAGTKLQVTFHRVRQELEGLDLDDDLLDFREQASAHLLYHQWMLRESLDAALSYRVRNRAFLKQRVNGLGAPADRLRALRLALNAPG
jgi:hypothetical protein